MNRKQEERRTRLRHEERRKARRESCPERLLRLIDEAWPFEDVCDAVSMEIARIRPSRDDCNAIYVELRRKMARTLRPLKPEAYERVKNEIRMLEYALSEALDYMEG